MNELTPKKVESGIPHTDIYGHPIKFSLFVTRERQIQLQIPDKLFIVIRNIYGRVEEADRMTVIGVHARITNNPFEPTKTTSIARLFFDGSTEGDTRVFEWAGDALNFFDASNSFGDNLATTRQGVVRIASEEARAYQERIKQGLSAIKNKSHPPNTAVSGAE